MSDPATKRRKIKYPSWAPPDLREYHEKMITGNKHVPHPKHFPSDDHMYLDISMPTDEMVDVLERLITFERMKHVWPQLRKRTNEPSIGVLLFLQVRHALFRVQSRGQETRAELKDRYSRIRKAARELAIAVQNSKFDISPSAFSGVEEAWFPLNADFHQGFTVANFAKNLADAAKIAHENLDHEDLLVLHPRRGSAERTAFIRALADEFASTYDALLYRTLANVASAVLDDLNISEPTVIQALDEE